MQQIDPMQLLQLIRNGKNPQQLIMGILDQQAQTNPIYKNLSSMAKEGRTKDIERFARNLVETQGYDFDKEFNAFRKHYGL